MPREYEQNSECFQCHSECLVQNSTEPYLTCTGPVSAHTLVVLRIFLRIFEYIILLPHANIGVLTNK